MARTRHTDYWNVRTHSDRRSHEGEFQAWTGLCLIPFFAAGRWVIDSFRVRNQRTA